jgi:hypothetical protein
LVEEDLDSKNQQDLKIIRSVITDLLDESIQSVKLFDFFQISGKVMNICEDNCCFDFYCSNCFKNEKNIQKSNLAVQKTTLNKQKLMFNIDSKYAITSMILDFLFAKFFFHREWICETCEKIDIEPIICVQMQIICKEIYLIRLLKYVLALFYYYFVVNCIGVSRLVKIKLHTDTISSMLPLDTIKKSFAQNVEGTQVNY